MDFEDSDNHSLGDKIEHNNIDDEEDEGITLDDFDYNSDDDASDGINIYGKGTHEEDDEQHGHHSLPAYPSVRAFRRRSMFSRTKRCLSLRNLCRKCNFLTITLLIGLIGCVAVLIYQQREIAKGRMGSLVGGSTEWAALPPANKPLKSLAFGSCSNQKYPMTYWDTLSSLRPDVTILMGDNVYGKCDGSGCQDLQDAYDALASHLSFVGAKSMLPMVATLDNHDYGRNDANEKNPNKAVAKEMFLDFFGVPPDDERRSRPNDGVYTSYEWGPEGQRVQVILLDVRYHHSEFKLTDDYNAPGKERYVPDDDPKKRLMSEAQWGWLERLISRPANVRIIVSSIQVMADGHGFECWRMIPHEREKLYKTLQPTLEETRTILLSGDRHVGGFYKHETEDLYEVTASSWTHTIPYGAYDDCSNSQECDEVDPRRMHDFVRVNNFGMVDLDWEKKEVTVSLKRVSSSLEDIYQKHGAEPGDTLQYWVFAIP